MNIDTTNILNDSYICFIDNIFDNHLNTINNIFYDFKNRFSITPFFLAKLKVTDLTDFIIDLYNFNKHGNIINDGTGRGTFNNYYNSELNISYEIITNFLKQNKFNLNLHYNNWINFCYKFSDLYEFLHLNYL
jgi:hypothetical protein